MFACLNGHSYGQLRDMKPIIEADLRNSVKGHCDEPLNGLFRAVGEAGRIRRFVTKGRKLLHWNDVKRYDQPLRLFMAQGDMQAVTLTGQEAKWILRVDVYLYVQTSGEPPAPIMNPLIDAVCNTVNAVHPITGKTALVVDGADIEVCRVEGTVETDEERLAIRRFVLSIVIAPRNAVYF